MMSFVDFVGGVDAVVIVHEAVSVSDVVLDVAVHDDAVIVDDDVICWCSCC